MPGTVGNVGSFVNFDDTTGELKLIVSKNPSIETAMANGTAPGHSTWMLRTDVIRNLKYDETLTSGVDNNIMLRLLRSGLKLTHVGKPVTFRRMHSRQVTVTDTDRQLASASSALKFIQWRLNPGDLKNIAAEAREMGEYPQTAPRDEMLNEASLYLPDHLANRDLVLAVATGSPVPDKWDGELVRAEISSGSEEVPHVPLAIVRNATFGDLVTARQSNLDFSVVPRTMENGDAPGDAGQISLILKSARSAISTEGLEKLFVLIKKDDSEEHATLPWEVRICGADQVGAVASENPAWMIFGEEYWENQSAD